MQWAQLQLRSACYVVISVMPSAQHASAARRSLLQVVHASAECRAHFDGSAGGAGGGALCVFARLRVPV